MLPNAQARQKRTNSATNWGKRYSAGRGTVEYINVSLRIPQDFTIYLGDPAVMPLWNDRPFFISIGNGGTSSNVEVVGSIRGTVMHVVCQDLIVRGDTQPTEAVPPDSGFRYQAHCGLGRPSSFNVASQSLHFDAPGLVVDIPVGGYVTHAWFAAVPSVGPPPSSIDDTTVQQLSRSPSGDVPLGPAESLAAWLSPRPMDPRTNFMQLTIGAGASPGGLDLTTFQTVML